jgi:Na+/H+-translocating membrane pyrophosphatase
MSNSTVAFFSGFSFLLGAAFSGISGYSGIWVSVRANVRVASAARSCYNTAL